MRSRFAFFTAVVAAALACAPAFAQAPLKLGLLLDMSGPYADITGQGSVTAARMAVEDFGGKVLGRPIEIVSADHQNKADLAGSIARQWFDDQGVEAILDVAASATALAANEVAKQRNKIIIMSGPGVTRLTNEECGPYTVHYAYDNYALAKGTGVATVKAGYDSWFFITADYAFGAALERDTTAAVKALGGKVLGGVKAPLSTSDRISRGTPRPSSPRTAARCWAPCACRSTRPISPPSCCRRKPRRRRSSASPMRAPTPSTPSSRRPSSASGNRARSSPRSSSSSPM
jgi:branched-chain amino acid transport system substrate-binding protein